MYLAIVDSPIWQPSLTTRREYAARPKDDFQGTSDESTRGLQQKLLAYLALACSSIARKVANRLGAIG